MPLKDLSQQELSIILQCLKAAADGPFFDDCEFHTLFGVERAEVSRVIADWPEVDDASEDSDAHLAINNAMANLLGYPHRQDDKWSDFISAPPEEVMRIFKKWRGVSIGSYFGGLE